MYRNLFELVAGDCCGFLTMLIKKKTTKNTHTHKLESEVSSKQNETNQKKFIRIQHIKKFFSSSSLFVYSLRHLDVEDFCPIS